MGKRSHIVWGGSPDGIDDGYGGLLAMPRELASSPAQTGRDDAPLACSLMMEGPSIAAR
jgi:hypothetical protein